MAGAYLFVTLSSPVWERYKIEADLSCWKSEGAQCYVLGYVSALEIEVSLVFEICSVWSHARDKEKAAE